jgi:MFS family permease
VNDQTSLSPSDDNQTFRALRFSLWDGIFFSAMTALVDTFAVAGAVYLKAPPIAIGLLAGIPLLLGSIGQLVFPMVLNPALGRKHYVIKGTVGQTIALFLLALSGWLPPHLRTWAYVAVFAIQGFFGNVVTGFWLAWMSSLVDPAVRGQYFARRNLIISCAQLVCGLTAGALAFRQTTETTSWLFFTCLFVGAGFFRFLSTAMLSRQYEPRPVITVPDRPTPASDEENPRGFLIFCLAVALMQGAVALAGPFFNVWFVRDLHFNYFTLAACTASMVLGTIIALPLWGKLSDRIGHRRVFLITGFMVSSVPLAFMFTGIPWLVCVLNAWSGIAWSGYMLSNYNFLLQLTNNKNQGRQTSLAVAFTGISVFFFSLLGGFLAPRLPTIAGWQLQSLFLLSSFLRFTVFGLLFLRLPRPKHESPYGKTEFFQFARKLFDSA